MKPPLLCSRHLPASFQDAFNLPANEFFVQVDYLRVRRDPAGIAVTPKMDTPQKSESRFNIDSEFAITAGTLRHYRLPNRGTYVEVLP
jgi:hypothetical protein